jgi:hypothetical protein
LADLFSIYPTLSNILAPLAQQAGQALGVAPSTVLSQWALESQYGEYPSAVAANNFAGIMQPGTQTLQQFDSPQSFEQAYVNLIENGYPGAMNTGSDVNAFVNGLTSNPNHLYTTTAPTAYANSLSGVAAKIAGLVSGLAPSSQTTSSGTSGVATPTTSAATSATSALSSVGNIFTWIYNNPLSAMVLVIVALATVGIVISTVWNSGKEVAAHV